MIRTAQPSIFCNYLFSRLCLLDRDGETVGWHGRCKKSHTREHSDGTVKKEVASHCARRAGHWEVMAWQLWAPTPTSLPLVSLVAKAG